MRDSDEYHDEHSVWYSDEYSDEYGDEYIDEQSVAYSGVHCEYMRDYSRRMQ
jgi:hypothetical protein